MTILEITDVEELLCATPPSAATTALDDAAAWVGSRSPTEIAPRRR